MSSNPAVSGSHNCQQSRHCILLSQVHLSRCGHPASTQALISSHLHRTTLPIRTGFGIRPVTCSEETCRAETLSSFETSFVSRSRPKCSGCFWPPNRAFCDASIGVIFDRCEFGSSHWL